MSIEDRLASIDRRLAAIELRANLEEAAEFLLEKLIEQFEGGTPEGVRSYLAKKGYTAQVFAGLLRSGSPSDLTIVHLLFDWRRVGPVLSRRFGLRLPADRTGVTS